MADKTYTHKVITVTDGNLVESCESEVEADYSCKTRNEQAEKLGIKTRYKVVAMEPAPA